MELQLLLDQAKSLRVKRVKGYLANFDIYQGPSSRGIGNCYGQKGGLDGEKILTSAIMSVEQRGELFVLTTFDGYNYIVLNLNPRVGPIDVLSLDMARRMRGNDSNRSD
ncbi:hypothetical protein EF096_06045 [Pseudomonas neustonica]|uniref:Uncharacterized protein n=1 Tax=Pseudomonas neustonica TaxID=2487346 RepID=A0ABX9XJJ0_9PSED|nr:MULTISPECIES: hypothetical protein [Pseudomonas]ROZ84501.1 hypothetical protein EF099_06455 [Pseudomonas sp. SSM44]ROZ86304.1 hypothetical protein EF096_06045 [Pseudomonas neustonica]|tara:strand:- start:1138 stop:1464 length:327 start_codon:yes stop_codon:yes gene_type:complete